MKRGLRLLPIGLVLAAFASAAGSSWAAEGFRKLSGPDIKRLFADLHLANYPDDGTGGTNNVWAITFNANGTFDGDSFGTGDNGYGNWRVEGDRQCVEVDTVHYQNYGEGSEPLSGCFEVFVDAKRGIIAFGDGGILQTVNTDAKGEIAALTPAHTPPKAVAAKPAPEPKSEPAPEPKAAPEPAPTPKPVAEPKPRDDALERQRLELERERLAGEAKLKEMRLALERERVRQELAMQREKIELQRQAMILQRQKKGLTRGQDLAPPSIRVPGRLETKARTVTVVGVVEDDDPVIRVEINGEAVRFGREDGQFAKDVPVALGASDIRVTAYAFVENATLAAGLYVADHVFFALAIAIKTYFQKIADPADIASTAGVSFTISHIAAIVIPAAFGVL